MTWTVSHIQNPTARNLTRRLLKEFEPLGIYIYHVSTWDSVYIKFAHNELRSIRIGDHKGRQKYKYKWNIDLEGKTRTETDDGIKRFYYTPEDVDLLINAIYERAKNFLPENISDYKNLSVPAPSAE